MFQLNTLGVYMKLFFACKPSWPVESVPHTKTLVPVELSVPVYNLGSFDLTESLVIVTVDGADEGEVTPDCGSYERCLLIPLRVAKKSFRPFLSIKFSFYSRLLWQTIPAWVVQKSLTA